MSVIAFPTTSIVSEDVAEAEFNRFVDAMELDHSRIETEEDRRSYQDQKRKVIRALTQGRLIFDDKGQPIYSPVTGGNPITFREPDGGTLAAMDQAREGKNVEKMHRLLAAMTGENVSRFGRMPQRDLKVCQAIAALFLAS